ncbi:MAG: hypothetical protein HZC48_02855 [Nitrospirae bacterium]|nr:hypothetical protein [Nitrospirota bacterium]
MLKVKGIGPKKLNKFRSCR